MSDTTADESFKRGLNAMVESRFGDAARQFRDAIETERRLRAAPPDMRYLSYYGLCVAHSEDPRGTALQACKMAARRDPKRPILLLNLGRVYLMAGNRALAFECFGKAAALAPDHGSLRKQLDRMERRMKPMIRALPRANLLNVWLGRLLAKMRPKSHDQADRPVRRKAA